MAERREPREVPKPAPKARDLKSPSMERYKRKIKNKYRLRRDAAGRVERNPRRSNYDPYEG